MSVCVCERVQCVCDPVIAAQTPIEEFTPTPAFPALQYLESVDEGGVAWRAGLRMGDFLIEVCAELNHGTCSTFCYRVSSSLSRFLSLSLPLLPIKVNGQNVVKVGHRQVVNMIRQGGNSLMVKVVMVTRNPDLDDGTRKKSKRKVLLLLLLLLLLMMLMMMMMKGRVTALLVAMTMMMILMLSINISKGYAASTEDCGDEDCG